MATLRDIKRRITGVKNTQQITKAMKMVAAARLRRAQENIINARPYSRKLQDVLGNLLSIEGSAGNPLLEQRDIIQNVAVIVITSDRGLCGGFNMNAIRETEELMNTELSQFKGDNIALYCVGKKGLDHFSKRSYNLAGKHPGIFSDLKYDFASTLMNEITRKFLDREFDKVIVVYNEFKSVVQQKVVRKQLLPILTDHEKKEDQNINIEYIYEPDKISIINALLPRHLNALMWTALLDSYAAELGARMTAMDMATENAKELIRTLQITYNKERQASITSEILEIVSGANALKKGN
ncbi:MAG: ATP synthase F1 subunit gamma [Melioribacteraceae bacterium]|nr:ATP synthase F1 subunit gamma [Melioribacteraceae bacterium]